MKNQFNKLILITAMIAGQFCSVAQNKMVFSSKPFSQGGTEQTEFKAGTPIYGRIILDKPLKSYCKNPAKRLDNVPQNYARLISIKPVTRRDDSDSEDSFDEVLGIDYKMFLSFADLEKNYIDFDIMPTGAEATSEFTDGHTAFFWAYASPDMAIGKKSHFAIKLYSEANESNAQIFDLKSLGEFYIDYTASTAESQEKWYAQCKEALNKAKSNALKGASKNAAAEAQKLPLPSCFSKGNNPGYTNPENSTAKIMALIKQKYGITEVLKLTFDKADGVDDFRTLVDANTNVASCKMGNHVFYFAFRDKDGTYRFAGGTLTKDHVGYGKFGETYIKNYSPIQGEEKYPLDVLRDSQGTYGVFLFDGAKLK